MKLLILRHGKAYDANPIQWPDDSDRPLTDDGKKRLIRSAPAIKALAPKNTRVISSPYTRALQTAQIVCQEVGWDAPEIDDRLSAHCGPEEALELLQSLPVSGNYVIVGHDPTFSFLPGYLIGANRIDATPLKTGAVALIDTGMAPPAQGTGTLVSLIQPKILAR